MFERIERIDHRVARILELLEKQEHGGSKPKHPPVSLRIIFGPVGEIMSTAVLHTTDKNVGATLVFKDSAGNVVPPASPPVWSLSANGIVTMSVSPDGMTAAFAPVAAGAVTVNVVAEGDVTPGVDTIHGSGDITVLGAEAATVELTFGPVT